MHRFTFDKRNAFLDQIEQAGLRLGDFVMSSSTHSTFEIQYRHDYFYFSITQNDHDAFSTRFKNIHETEASEVRSTWVHSLARFTRWLNEIESDRKEEMRFHQRYSSLRIDSNEYLSERFVDVLRQGEAAENYGLSELCGMAYRKAFEIMMKDYVMIGKDEEARLTIANTQIREVIKSHVNDDDLKLLAHGVLELGNDHAHYLQKYSDSNIAELKELIRKAAHWIMNHEEVKKVELVRKTEIREATEKFVKD